MIKKKTTHRKKLSKRILSKIVIKDLLPYLTDKPAMAPSKTGSIEKANAPTKIDLDSKVELPAKPFLYHENLNPFRPTLSEIRLNEDENMKLNEFLNRVFVAEDIEGLDKIVNQALDSGIRINAHNEDEYSFSNITIFMLCKDKFKGDKQENIIRKLAINGADFDKSFIQGSRKTIEICNKVQKEVEPIVFNRLQKLREVAESAVIEGTVGTVEIDNRTFYIEFSQSSKIDAGKVINGARDLGLSNGTLNLGGNIIRLGDSELEIKTEKNGKRNYVDVSDNSAFEVTFLTSLGNLSITVYHNLEDYHQIHVKVKDETMWNELQRIGEIVGNGCMFSGMSVTAAIKQGCFIRSGRFCDQKSTEAIKLSESSETISWVEKEKGREQSTTSRAIH
ncbi:hypothetical protein [Wolbachia endosymbiont of Folsomia candida]|uniref:hypothetical protein n=1 Tax=Wolbachia endosymbiont of Folsomia candida TaxID=169402 RepID=UPI000AFDC1C1|nr:hypothetical protein [Wolbachia endosymbiont of Folsomia candida]APR98602.1 hypothetical protein ASM33_05110 [Wolbachia endosymbiont of Folsomia candida]